MRDCVIVGSGRSGTSLAAGLLARAGYDCGDDLLPPDPGGPTGFFEARGMNALNEALLATCDSEVRSEGYSRPLRDGERWLAVLPAGVEPEAPARMRQQMTAAVPPSPYCCKDPRFGYTLGSWRPLFAGALFACVFRHPAATARSISRDVRYTDLKVDDEAALAIWQAIYTRVLDVHRHEGDWLFVHYEQLLDGTGVERLARALDAQLDATLADRRLSRSPASGDVPERARTTYAELCALAGYRP